MDDYVSVEPTDNGRWSVSLWTLEGEEVPISTHRRQSEAEEKAQAIAECVDTWMVNKENR